MHVLSVQKLLPLCLCLSFFLFFSRPLCVFLSSAFFHLSRFSLVFFFFCAFCVEGVDWESLKDRVNRQLLFHPSMPIMRYFVREPIENRYLSHTPLSLPSCLLLSSALRPSTSECSSSSSSYLVYVPGHVSRSVSTDICDSRGVVPVEKEDVSPIHSNFLVCCRSSFFH